MENGIERAPGNCAKGIWFYTVVSLLVEDFDFAASFGVRLALENVADHAEVNIFRQGHRLFDHFLLVSFSL